MITINIKNEYGTAKIELKKESLNRFYNAGHEFDLQLTKENISEVLNENPHIASEILIWGDDTLAGDDFFKALVESIMDVSWNEVQEIYKDKAYEIVKAKAILKGYKPNN